VFNKRVTNIRCRLVPANSRVANRLAPRSTTDKFSPVKGWEIAVGLGTITCFVAVISSGVSEWLTFIPESWGSTDEDGEFVSARRGISYIFGFVGALGVFHLLGCYAAQRDSERKRKAS
jgi:hypothetical protein